MNKNIDNFIENTIKNIEKYKDIEEKKKIYQKKVIKVIINRLINETKKEKKYFINPKKEEEFLEYVNNFVTNNTTEDIESYIKCLGKVKIKPPLIMVDKDLLDLFRNILPKNEVEKTNPTKTIHNHLVPEYIKDLVVLERKVPEYKNEYIQKVSKTLWKNKLSEEEDTMVVDSKHTIPSLVGHTPYGNPYISSPTNYGLVQNIFLQRLSDQEIQDFFENLAYQLFDNE